MCVFSERKAKEKEEELKRSTERFREIARRVIQEQLLVVLCADKYSTTRWTKKRNTIVLELSKCQIFANQHVKILETEFSLSIIQRDSCSNDVVDDKSNDWWD